MVFRHRTKTFVKLSIDDALNWREFLCVAILYVVFFVFALQANPFQSETVAPVSLLSNYSGWRSHIFTSKQTHPERSDILDVFLPQWVELKKQIRSGDSGIWNPLPGGGTPGFFELSRGALTPSFLAFLLFKSHWLGYYIAVLLRPILAALGTYLFLRFFLKSKKAAFFGGVVFSLCGFNTAWFHWPQVSTAVWIPWLLWACAGWCVYRSLKWFFANIVFTIFLITGGFPAVSAYGFYAVSLFLVLMLLQYYFDFLDTLFVFAGWVTSVVVGFMLTAIPLLTLLQMLSLVDLSYRTGGTSYQFPQDLTLLVDGFQYGLPLVEKTLFVGPVAVLFAILSLICLRQKNVESKEVVLVWYGWLLFIGSLIITFGLLPDSILVIPGVGSSPWNRFAVILDLSIAILASAGGSYLFSITRKIPTFCYRWAIYLILIICVGFQFASQVNLFRKFNTVATANDFFPEIPVFTSVAATLGPTQSVVADKSAFVGGTLGFYGIAEWFAHGFKTNSEKALLNLLVENPFRTPTAAVFPASAILPNADLYARLGIRYVVHENSNLEHVREENYSTKYPAPALPQNELKQVICVNENLTIDAIGILLATYCASQAPSDVLLELSDEKGSVLATSYLNAEKIKDNQNAIFELGERVELTHGFYSLRICLSDPLAKGNLTVWCSKKSSHEGESVIVNNEKMDGSFLYTLYRRDKKFNPKYWKAHKEFGGDVELFENLLTPYGAYFINSLEEKASFSSENVVTTRPSSGIIKVTYKGSGSGYVVIPMRTYPGWTPYLAGEKIHLFSYLGVLPAIPVHGPAELIFVYEPNFFRIGFVFMAIGVLIFLLASWFLIYMPSKFKNKIRS